MDRASTCRLERHTDKRFVSSAGSGVEIRAISRRNVGLYTVRYCGCYEDENNILFASKHTVTVTVSRFSSSKTCLPTPIGLQEMKSDLQYKRVVSARRHPASTMSGHTEASGPVRLYIKTINGSTLMAIKDEVLRPIAFQVKERPTRDSETP